MNGIVLICTLNDARYSPTTIAILALLSAYLSYCTGLSCKEMCAILGTIIIPSPCKAFSENKRLAFGYSSSET